MTGRRLPRWSELAPGRVAEMVDQVLLGVTSMAGLTPDRARLRQGRSGR
ncbi:MAG: hypothetical protein ACYCXA_10360 [Actinomycetes bacterium]